MMPAGFAPLSPIPWGGIYETGDRPGSPQRGTPAGVPADHPLAARGKIDAGVVGIGRAKK
jgi:hypothetical protein